MKIYYKNILHNTQDIKFYKGYINIQSACNELCYYMRDSNTNKSPLGRSRIVIKILFFHTLKATPPSKIRV